MLCFDFRSQISDTNLRSNLRSQITDLNSTVTPIRIPQSPIRNQYTPSTTLVCNFENGLTFRTPSHGYNSHGGSRSASSRSKNLGMKNSFVSVVSLTRPVAP